MTDRELLELAAKAAGIEINWFKWERLTNQWNPITDDGDALRLAVKLDINVYVHLVSGSTMASAKPEIDEVEPHGNDPYAATRRAITCAAAEIGKAMP
jgi:hypothetical protein